MQFAKAQGARVLATASSDKIALLRELGVEEPIDYTTTRFEDVAHDVDVVFDTVGGELLERSFKVLKPGGILAQDAAVFLDALNQAWAESHPLTLVGAPAAEDASCDDGSCAVVPGAGHDDRPVRE